MTAHVPVPILPDRMRNKGRVAIYRARRLVDDAPGSLSVVLTSMAGGFRWRLDGWGLELIEGAPIAGHAPTVRAALAAAGEAVRRHLDRRPVLAAV